jgi:hypothetical protein
MSSVPPRRTASPAQQAAERHALAMAEIMAEHRRAMTALRGSRGGMCLADGLNVSIVPLDGDFDLDSAVVRGLLAGPSPAAAPSAAGGRSALERYLYPDDPSAAPGTWQRVGQEVPGATYGAGNLLGNAAGVAGGVLQGVGERSGRAAMEQGIAAILSRQAQRVPLAPGVELYNAAQGRQPPRVRLRVRNLPIADIRAMVPTPGGPATQWRVNGAATSSTLKVRGMTSQQLRQSAILVGQERLPASMRWAGTKVGGGVLAFAPSAALDLYQSVEVDAFGRRQVNWTQFGVASAKSQSGNALGFFTGVGITYAAAAVGGAALAASAPVLLLALGAGILVQVAWNASGAADWTSRQAAAALQ